MAATTHRPLRAVALLLAFAALGGCATRFDNFGNRIYVWQFGQDTTRGIDYSNPRLPILPRQAPNFDLWEIPSPYQFNDLSQYSFLVPQDPLPPALIAVGDNAGCAASCDSKAPLALAAVGADLRDRGRSSPGH